MNICLFIRRYIYITRLHDNYNIRVVSKYAYLRGVGGDEGGGGVIMVSTVTVTGGTGIQNVHVATIIIY